MHKANFDLLQHFVDAEGLEQETFLLLQESVPKLDPQMAEKLYGLFINAVDSEWVDEFVHTLTRCYEGDFHKSFLKASQIWTSEPEEPLQDYLPRDFLALRM